jgi:hypothetical protein
MATLGEHIQRIKPEVFSYGTNDEGKAVSLDKEKKTYTWEDVISPEDRYKLLPWERKLAETSFGKQTPPKTAFQLQKQRYTDYKQTYKNYLQKYHPKEFKKYFPKEYAKSKFWQRGWFSQMKDLRNWSSRPEVRHHKIFDIPVKEWTYHLGNIGKKSLGWGLLYQSITYSGNIPNDFEEREMSRFGAIADHYIEEAYAPEYDKDGNMTGNVAESKKLDYDVKDFMPYLKDGKLVDPMEEWWPVPEDQIPENVKLTEFGYNYEVYTMQQKMKKIEELQDRRDASWEEQAEESAHLKETRDLFFPDLTKTGIDPHWKREIYWEDYQ